jgi:hypothetical protein
MAQQPPASFFPRKGVEVPLRADVERVVRDGRCCRDPFAQGRIRSHHLGSCRSHLQDRDRSVVQRCQVDVTVGRDGGGVVAAGRGAPLLDVDLFARFRVVVVRPLVTDRRDYRFLATKLVATKLVIVLQFCVGRWSRR